MDQQASMLLSDLQRATSRLLTAAGGLTDEQARAASRLPGWSRGHVLTHLARNGDALRNLLSWARTGVRTPAYASPGARQADIEAGAGRPAAELAADVRAAAGRFEAEAASMPATAWAAVVQWALGDVSARQVLLMRQFEVHVHHVDLGLGYRPSDWPDRFARAALPIAVTGFAGRDDVPACRIEPAGGEPQQFGPAGAANPVTVSGPAWALLAWVTGRGTAQSLTADGGALPVLPGWR
jgi:maleylpyruvate isomerase